MEVANKFELHYYLNNESHQINALLRNRCEAELLAIILEVSLILDIEVELLATAAKEGGFREVWDAAKGNINAINALLIVVQIIVTTAPMLYESEKEALEKELLRHQIEESKLNTKKLRNELNTSNYDQTSARKTAAYLSSNLRIIKRKSNFYSVLSKRPEIDKIGFNILNEKFVPQSDEIQVAKKDFRKFVLNSNRLKAEEVDAKIEIISPVLKEGNYKWKGIYNDQIIGFDMLDLEFQDMVLLDNIPFQHGSSINCVLRISKELDEAGDVKVTGYAVTTVIEKIDGLTSIQTTQGKKYRHTKKQMDNQGNLFA